jgi:hypothetical protein
MANDSRWQKDWHWGLPRVMQKVKKMATRKGLKMTRQKMKTQYNILLS